MGFPCALKIDDGSDEYFEDTADIFSRLEEIRARLEEELGLDVLQKAYLAVQVSFLSSDLPFRLSLFSFN